MWNKLSSSVSYAYIVCYSNLCVWREAGEWEMRYVMITYPGEEANHGLHLVPCHGVPNKSHRLSSSDLEELSRIEYRKLTSIGLPPPLHELGVGSPVLHAVLVFVDSPAGLVCVVRCPPVRDPLPGENVARWRSHGTLLLHYVGGGW